MYNFCGQLSPKPFFSEPKSWSKARLNQVAALVLEQTVTTCRRGPYLREWWGLPLLNSQLNISGPHQTMVTFPSFRILSLRSTDIQNKTGRHYNSDSGTERHKRTDRKRTEQTVIGKEQTTDSDRQRTDSLDSSTGLFYTSTTCSCFWMRTLLQFV